MNHTETEEYLKRKTAEHQRLIQERERLEGRKSQVLAEIDWNERRTIQVQEEIARCEKELAKPQTVPQQELAPIEL